MDRRRGPLILGSGGRVGRLLRHLAAQGLWPGPEPIWHTRDGRDGTTGWDLAGPPPEDLDLGGVAGVVVLARAAPGQRGGLDTGRLVATALGLGVGPVLLPSSAAVYTGHPGPGREEERPPPATPYAASKLALEAAAGGRACCLRLGNVAGADALFGAMASGPVALDRFPDGSAPRRAYIGPLTLARALVALLAREDLPPVLNLAQPGPVAMDALLEAAGVAWDGVPAPPGARPALEMDVTRAAALAPLPPARAKTLVAEARRAGWRPFLPT